MDTERRAQDLPDEERERTIAPLIDAVVHSRSPPYTTSSRIWSTRTAFESSSTPSSTFITRISLNAAAIASAPGSPNPNRSRSRGGYSTPSEPEADVATESRQRTARQSSAARNGAAVDRPGSSGEHGCNSAERSISVPCTAESGGAPFCSSGTTYRSMCNCALVFRIRSTASSTLRCRDRLATGRSSGQCSSGKCFRINSHWSPVMRNTHQSYPLERVTRF